ncbi:hypothetical protein DL771_001611 [Monosporascus sp. 5C6A]|nr:hypothetical protein DL771_001611 [Monosporascus sp. 5C6A]
MRLVNFAFAAGLSALAASFPLSFPASQVVSDATHTAAVTYWEQPIPVSERRVTDASMAHEPTTQAKDEAKTEWNEGHLDVAKDPNASHTQPTPAITSIPTPYRGSSSPTTIAGSSLAAASTTAKQQEVIVHDVSKHATAMKLKVGRHVIIIVDKDHPFSPMWILAVVITSLLLLGQIISCAIICCVDYERSRNKRQAAAGSAGDVESGLALKGDSFSFQVQHTETQPLLHKS